MYNIIHSVYIPYISLHMVFRPSIYPRLAILRDAEVKKMETLELKPLEKKKLNVLLLEKEYNEPFWVNEAPANANELKSLQKPSIGFYKFLENLLSKVNVDFATDELGMRSQQDFQNDIITEVFHKSNIPYFPVDIDANAKAYIGDAIRQKNKVKRRFGKSIRQLLKTKRRHNGKRIHDRPRTRPTI